MLICSIYKIYHLTLRAIFSDETGLSCAMKLDDLPVHFSDLFNPLQVPACFKVSNTWLSFRNVHCSHMFLDLPQVELWLTLPQSAYSSPSSEAREPSSSHVRNQHAREEFWEGTFRKSTVFRTYHMLDNIFCWLRAENYSAEDIKIFPT